MKDNNIKKYIIVILLMLVVLVSGTTYALFTKTVNTKGVITIKSGKRYIGIYGPDKENMGLNVTYTFTIENRGTEEASYQVTIEDIINTVGRENIAYTYTNGTTTKTGKLSDGVIEEENLGVGEKVTVTITLTSDLSGDYKGKIKVTTGESKRGYVPNFPIDTSGANPPELVGDMIPVVYNEDNNHWVKADTTKNWYNYNEQVWANAVTIRNQTKRAEYVAASAGVEIPIEDMNTMLVWIPRYSYTLGNTYGYQIEGANIPSKETPGAFDIKFVDKDTTEMGSGKYTGDTPSEYFTPSSFCWGDTCDEEATRKDSGNIELSGIWVAKFEIAGVLIEEVRSVPLLARHTNASYNISTMFNGISSQLNGTNGTSNYGLRGNYDAHMIKNTEWGAMAYLSQSKYGKYGNKNYIGVNKEIYSNNRSPQTTIDPIYKSGCSSGKIPDLDQSSYNCDYEYNEGLEGAGASTTGTIYGIYDTVGGSYEQVMGAYPRISKTGFNSLPAKKYYNAYLEQKSYDTEFSKQIKGDAMSAKETNEFYKQINRAPANSWYWINRGGLAGGSTGYCGIFSNLTLDGSALKDFTTRFTIITW